MRIINKQAKQHQAAAAMKKAWRKSKKEKAGRVAGMAKNGVET